MDTITPPRRRARTWLVAAVAAALAIPVVLPDLVGLDRSTPFAQLVAFRPLLLGVATVLLVLVVLARRRVGPVTASLALVLLVGGSGLVGRVVPDAAGAGLELTVLTVNVYDGNAAPAQVAALVADARPALVSLPEAGAAFRAKLAPLVEPLGYRLYGTTGPGERDIGGVSALSRADLGELDAVVDDATPFRSLVLSGGNLGDLRFVAVHIVSPVPSGVPQWRADLAHLATWCAAPGTTVLAGDLNASLDHSALRAGTTGCADAAAQAGAGLIGTWPSTLPPWAGAQIDHVLSTGGIVAESVTVHYIARTDHRALLARLRLPA